MKKIITLISMIFILVSCGWEKQYDYSWVSTLDDGQQEIQPAKIEVVAMDDTNNQDFEEPGE